MHVIIDNASVSPSMMEKNSVLVRDKEMDLEEKKKAVETWSLGLSF